MSRIHQVAPDVAVGRVKELFDAVKGKLGLVPNVVRAMGNSPAALEGYVTLSGAVSKSGLSSKMRAQISLAVAEANGCNYCLAAHSTVGRMVGLTADQILDSRRGTAIDPKSDAVIRFAREVAETRGRVSDRSLESLRVLDFSDKMIAEIIAAVALNIFTNYFNNVAETDIDFPEAEPLVDRHEYASSTGYSVTR